MSATAVYCPTCGKPNWPGRDTCEFCWAPFAPAAVPPGKPLPTLPVPLLVVLHYLTLGIFPLIWLNLYHGHLPRRRPDDPSAGAAVGRLFIPFYHLYWLFFTHARLADRLEEERDRYGLPRENLYDLLIACGIAALTPCLNIAALLLLFPIAAGLLQHQFNELARAQAQAQPAEPVASLRCPGCGQESPAAAIYCYHCGSVLAAAAPQSPEFYGTGGELLGRVLLAGLSMLPLVSAGYGFAYAWSWLVDRLCLPRGIRLSYQQNGRAIWLPAAGYALLTLGPAVLAMQVAGRHDLDFLSVLLPLGLVPITAGLLLVLLRRLLGATRMPDGAPLAFRGEYGYLLGWLLLLGLVSSPPSAYITMAGPMDPLLQMAVLGALSLAFLPLYAAVLLGALRWAASAISVPGLGLAFGGRWHQVFWRLLVANLTLLGLVAYAWGMSWFLRWLVRTIRVTPAKVEALPAE